MSRATIETAEIEDVTALERRAVTPSRQIGLLLFEGFSFLAAGMLAEVFELANDAFIIDAGKGTRYDLRLLSIDGGEVACSSSARASTDRLDPREVGALHALFFMGDPGERESEGDRWLVDWLRVLYPPAALTEGTGSRVAINGVVGARRARSPQPRPSSDRVLGLQRAMGGGSSAADDPRRAMCSALVQVRRDLGRDVAIKVAEALSPGLSGQLVPLLDEVHDRSSGDKVRASARWLLANCEQPITVVDAARVAVMSERNFLRCFKREMGVTPSEFLLQARLEVTRRLLVKTKLPVDNIARCTGMRSGNRLAKMFRKRFAVSPTEYRLRINLGVDEVPTQSGLSRIESCPSSMQGS